MAASKICGCISNRSTAIEDQNGFVLTGCGKSMTLEKMVAQVHNHAETILRGSLRLDRVTKTIP